MTVGEFPRLEGWEATRDALHSYARVVCAVPRALAEPHPKWWHISLKPHNDGAATDPISVHGNASGAVQLVLNLRSHAVDLLYNSMVVGSFTLTAVPSAAALADGLVVELNGLGVQPKLDPSQIDAAGPFAYQPDHAEAYRAALHLTARVLNQHREQLTGDTGPVQLWPHNFDLAFEWFGTLRVPYDEPAGTREQPSQINFGFAPGDDSHPEPYFYSNPWPFDEQLVGQELPSGARWFTESWKGTLLPYSDMVGRSADRLLAYYRAVYDLASPGLMA